MSQLGCSVFGQRLHLKIFVQISDTDWSPNCLTTEPILMRQNPNEFGFWCSSVRVNCQCNFFQFNFLQENKHECKAYNHSSAFLLISNRRSILTADLQERSLERLPVRFHLHFRSYFKTVSNHPNKLYQICTAGIGTLEIWTF